MHLSFGQQSLNVVQYDISSGLSENVSISLYQDSRDFLWIGTYDGLNRFDGYSFKIFRDEFSESPISTNRFYAVREDDNGLLWVSKDDGTHLFDPLIEKEISISSFPTRLFTRIGQDASGDYWVRYRNGLGKINEDYSDMDTVPYSKELSFPSQDMRSLGQKSIRNNEVYMYSLTGDVVLIDLETKALKWHPNPFLVKEAISAACITDSALFMANRDGQIFMYDLQSKKYKSLNHPASIVGKMNANQIYLDEKFNLLWFCTHKQGLLSYNLETLEWNHYEVKPPHKKSLSSENITAVLRDKRDVLWIATDQHGVFAHDPNLRKFNYLDPSSFGLEYDIHVPRKLAGDDYGNLWIGTNALGLWKYNEAAKTLKQFTIQSDPNLLVSNSVIQLMADGNRLYLGHNGHGISVWSLPKLKLLKQMQFESTDPGIKSNNIVWNIVKDNNGKIWIGTRTSGIYVMDPETFQYEHYYTGNTAIDQNTIQTIETKPDGTIVIATRVGGLFEWDEKNKDFNRVFPKNKVDQLSTKSFTFQEDGRLWIGTDGEGVWLLDDLYNLIAKATTKNGLLKNDAICSFLFESENTVWVSTNFGVNRLSFNPQDTTFKSRHYTSHDGLSSDEFVTGAYLKYNDKFWMGDIYGINYFEPAKIHDNPYPLKCLIKNIEVFNNGLDLDSSLISKKSVTLSPGQNALSIEYNSLGFTVPEKTNYKYRLLGYDNNWSAPTTRTFRSFTNLKPGTYTFEVKASNYDGLWSDIPAKLDIIVQPTFYQSNLFRWGLALLIMGLIYSFYKVRVNRFKLEENLKTAHFKALSQMEMKALRAQINPHFLFNTLNSINNYIIQNQGDKASHYLVKFSKLMRRILANSPAQFISIEEEIETLDLYIQLESMRFSYSFDYFINVEPGIDTKRLGIPPMLLQPFVENAIWHGLMHKKGDCTLEINIVKIPDDQLKISIRDNGIGRTKAGKLSKSDIKKKSYGMDITRKRLELMNEVRGNYSKIEVVDLEKTVPGQTGTEVNVFIPLTFLDRLKKEDEI